MAETTRALQKAATRDKILCAATQQFTAGGFGVPTTGIAKAAGVAHGSVFVHFPTRDALVDAVATAFFDKLNTSMHRAIEDTAGSTGIATLLNLHLDVLAAHEALYKNLLLDRALLPQATQDRIWACQTTLAHHFVYVIEAEQKAGRCKDIPPHMLFNTWMALLHYYLTNSHVFAPSEPVLPRYREELVATYLAMVERKA